MKTKTLSMFGLSIFVMILLISFASADMVFNPTSFSTTITQGTSNVNVDFDLDHTGIGGNYTSLIWTGESTQGSWTLPTSTTILNTNESLPLSATLGSIPSTFTGTITANITVNNSGSPYEVLPVTIIVTASSTPSSSGDFCTVEFGELDNNVSNPGELKIDIDDVDNKGQGSDDEWYPSDEIKITLDIDNDGDDDIDDISIEYGLWSEETDEWVIEIDEVDDFDLGDGKDETIEFTIDLYDDLEDVDELEDGDYVLYVRALGEVDDDTNPDTCASDSENIKILVEDDLVVLDDIKLTGTTLCGNTIQVTADVLNTGADDQDDVYVMIHNFELDINERANIGDIDAFENKVLNFEFTIPSDTEEKKYYLSLDVYDDDNDIYENDDDDESKYSVTLDISGNCQQVPDAVVYASLESGGKTGDELEIRATVTNNGDETGTFTVEAADYASWSELISVEPSSVTLDEDESRDVILTFKVDKDAEENQNFNIVLTSEDGASTSQPIAVTIEQGFSMSGLVGDNPYLWGIGLASLVLVILIVVVAVRASRR